MWTEGGPEGKYGRQEETQQGHPAWSREGQMGREDRAEGGPGTDGCGVLDVLKESRHRGSPASASRCSLSERLEQTLETVGMLTAMACVASGQTQGFEKGPRYSSRLYLQVPPARCGVTLCPCESQLSHLNNGDKVPASAVN